MNNKAVQILGISGSLRSRSSNTNLLRVLTALAPENVALTIYNGLGDLPHFNPEIDGDQPPASVEDLRNQIQSADAVLISTPEYANGVPGVLKNALDWLVSSGELYTKPVGVISASPHPSGGEKAHASLLLTLDMMTADVVEGGTLTIPYISLKMTPEGEMKDAATAQDLTLLLDALARRATAAESR